MKYPTPQRMFPNLYFYIMLFHIGGPGGGGGGCIIRERTTFLAYAIINLQTLSFSAPQNLEPETLEVV